MFVFFFSEILSGPAEIPINSFRGGGGGGYGGVVICLEQ